MSVFNNKKKFQKMAREKRNDVLGNTLKEQRTRC